MIYPEKLQSLIRSLERFEGITVAFSGGVDSSFLLVAAQLVFKDKVLAVTLRTPYIPAWELEESAQFCAKYSIKQRIIDTEIPDSIRNNPENRCYLCKKHLFSLIKQEALVNGLPLVADGSNADDTGVYRPGLVALKELNIISPLLENNITKSEIREFSRLLNIPVADKPAYACLLTRLPYNYEIKKEELSRIEAAERYLFSIGLNKSRVRNHGNIARIEIEKDKIPFLTSPYESEKLVSYFKELGYLYVTIDLEGFRSGSFDQNLNKKA